MNSTLKKVIIGVGILIVILVAFYYFSNSGSSQPTTTLTTQSGANASALVTNDQISKDTSFIATLLSLNKIQIDTSLLQSVSFKSLQDNTVKIVNDGVVGRTNPFAPFDQAPANTSTSLPSVTNNPSFVTPTTNINTPSNNAGATQPTKTTQ